MELNKNRRKYKIYVFDVNIITYVRLLKPVCACRSYGISVVLVPSSIWVMEGFI